MCFSTHGSKRLSSNPPTTTEIISSFAMRGLGPTKLRTGIARNGREGLRKTVSFQHAGTQHFTSPLRYPRPFREYFVQSQIHSFASFSRAVRCSRTCFNSAPPAESLSHVGYRFAPFLGLYKTDCDANARHRQFKQAMCY